MATSTRFSSSHNGADPSQSVVLKQALPYLRVAGEGWPLTRERMRFETQALLKHNELAPGLAPIVYDHDHEMSVVVMENLSDMEVMRKPLVARQRFPHFADHISTFLARTLFFTSDLYLTGVEKKEMQATFINPHLCKIQEDFVFTNPFMTSPENKWNPLLDAEVAAVRQDSELKLALAEMKERYMTHGQAMIHSDLHTGSIMANAQETRVIDPEFAFFGPAAFDIAALLENLVLNYLSHFAHTPDPAQRADYQAYLLETIREIWVQFAEEIRRSVGQQQPGRIGPHSLLGLSRRGRSLRRIPSPLYRPTAPRCGWLRRSQIPAPHDGHCHRLGHQQHRGPGSAGRGGAPGHPHRPPLDHGTQHRHQCG